MSGKSAADDFFGIEYMSSRPTDSEEGNKQEREPLVEDRIEKLGSPVDSDKVDRQLSGTEFLDRAFFGEIKHERITSEQSPSPSADFFEESFFKRIPAKGNGSSPFSQDAYEQMVKPSHRDHQGEETQRIFDRTPPAHRENSLDEGEQDHQLRVRASPSRQESSTQAGGKEEGSPGPPELEELEVRFFILIKSFTSHIQIASQLYPL
ncbi:hypothetical protein ANCCAN_30492 [Ancylostoma caninum]|uniref:Uncharacterized protein n=1 Tax=Ancylostoma caninum TaxID=29170 RepID=A0A368EYG7_ANCCA|nr:hypothetical protein ANCCAN_30492 [Ancylostoma caninum]